MPKAKKPKANVKPKPDGYKFGRPTLYGQHVLEIAQDYFFNDGYIKDGLSLPLLSGLCLRLEIARSTLNLWAIEHKDFSEILARGQQKLEAVLVTGATVGGYNPTFSGLVAANTLDWRSSKSDIDHKSSDGSMTPSRIEIVAGSKG